MKILYFHQHFSTPQGTTGIRSFQQAKRLCQEGHEVTIVCGSYGEGKTGLSSDFKKGMRQGIVEGIRVIEFNLAYANHDGFLKRAGIFLRYAFKSVRLALKENYDILFATSTPLTVAIPGIVARWLRRKPFVFEVRDLWPELPKAMKVITNPFILKGIGLLEWMAYHSATHLIGLSPGIVNGIAKRKISREKITFIPNACDLELFSSAIQPWRPSHIPPESFLAIFAGTHGIANGLDAVIDAAIELERTKRWDIHILFIGEGKLKPALISRVENIGLSNISFYEPVDKKKLVGLMKSAQLGLQILANVAAFYDGTSPNKFFDYLAAGLPVLNNYPGWLAELIKSKDCGYVVPPEAPALFAEALIAAADNPKEVYEKGENALTLARTSFDREKQAALFVNCLEQVYVCKKKNSQGSKHNKPYNINKPYPEREFRKDKLSD